jgi:hypothetical protein
LFPINTKLIALVTRLASNQDSKFVPELRMKPKQCTGGLSPKEIQQLEEETELRLHTCAVCGKRNLYAVKDGSGRWAPEPHTEPPPRVKHSVKNRQS